MALEDVSAGTLIPDNNTLLTDPNASWIRIADKTGSGFAESFADAPLYDEFSLKTNAKGNQVSYLEGDVVKVPAHWASPGSNLLSKGKS